jgi:threonine dehydratase
MRVVGVNAENSPHFYECFKQGRIVDIEPKPTLADAISGNPSWWPTHAVENLLTLCKETIDEVVLVSEEKIKQAIRLLALENKIVAEGAGAISLAAVLQTPKEERGKTVCIISGGSIDADKLVEILK